MCIRDRTTTEWQKSFTASSEVLFAVLSEDEILYYVDRYQPMDKAGAYGVQKMCIRDSGYALALGEAINSYYHYKLDGVWQKGEETDAAVFGLSLIHI